MQKQRLKKLIDSGAYRPEPAAVAQAMLRRRAVRELLIGAPVGSNGDGRLDGAAELGGSGKTSLSPTDRIPSPSAAPRQAA